MTEKLGFSVVAPMKVTSRFSTAGSSASCWDLEKRCTSSMNSTVSLPCDTSRSWARFSTSRTSLTPDVTAESSSNSRPDCLATMVASVVLPTPGGPNRMMELGAVSEPLEAGLARRRNGDPCPSTWLCPTTSSRVCGRIRTANGLVMSSGASEAPNKSCSLISLTLPRSRRAPGTIAYCAKPPPTPQCCRQPIGAIYHVWQYAIVIATVPRKTTIVTLRRYDGYR